MMHAIWRVSFLTVIGVVLFLLISDTAKAPSTEIPLATSTPQEAWVCDADAKICPDGTAVGRTGPECEFAACPSPEAREATLTTYIDGSPTTLNVTVNPKEVVSDSRCAEGVQCIWAGTVEVRTILSTEVSHGEHVMKLGEPQRFGDYDVTLTAVTPQPKAGEAIPVSSYRFSYEIKKR
jgi:hypothetical protein